MQLPHQDHDRHRLYLKDDLAVIGDQLKDAGIALKYYQQIMHEIEADSKETSAADLEALENAVG